MWAGSTYMCKNTQKVLVIPDKVKETDFFRFGDCYIDVGRRGFYSRFSGDMVFLGKPFKYNMFHVIDFIENTLQPKFSSGNEIPVQQTVIKRHEVEKLL